MQSSVTEKLQNIQPIVKRISLTTVLNECERAIIKYQLNTLLNKAKTNFKNLTDDEQDLVWAGLIKLGEALTFCRDKNNPQLMESGIIDPAIKFANARNYFIHHHIYYYHLQIQFKLQETMEKLSTIDFLQEKLGYLKNSGLNILSKEIKSGANDYPFGYIKQVEVLKAEFDKFEVLLKSIGSNENKIDSIIEIKLDNRIRNILTIMLDLTGEGSTNKYNSDDCNEEKQKVKNINSEFLNENDEFTELFLNLKKYRNALSHLDSSLKRPYEDKKQMLEFSRDLLKLKQLGYTQKLENVFLAPEIKDNEDFFLDMKKAGERLKPKLSKPISQEERRNVPQIESPATLIGKKRLHEQLNIEISQSDITETIIAKKQKTDAQNTEEKEEVNSFSLLAGYGSSSEAEEENKSEKDTPTNTNRPGSK